MSIEEQGLAATVAAIKISTSPIRQMAAIKGFNAGVKWERQRDKWISVKDKLPPKPGYYIAMCISPYKEPGLIHFHPRTGWENGFYDASHWQPLPEPPKE